MPPEPRWHRREHNGTRLFALDYGGTGPSVVLVHGLAGYAEEWEQTASWLSKSHRVVALEQRGHGRSERQPADVSRAAFVADAEMWVQELCMAPAVLVGQSLGGHTAFLLAAQRPDLVRGLVVAEATPQADARAPGAVRDWLDSWPVPFASRALAAQWFGGDPAWARAWAGGLEDRGDGLWPAFETDVMLAALEEVSHESYWEQWASIRCPLVIVRAAADGDESHQSPTLSKMVELRPSAHLAEVIGAGHDLHLDYPEAWRQALERFLATLE